jgi:cation diffusion facilitator family transporter
VRSSEQYSAQRAALASVLVGAAVLGLKLLAARVTDSVALLSDALESVVNVVAAAVLWAALRVSARPADHNHPYGHAKAEYFSAGFEGTLVVLAAATIAWQALARFGQPPRVPDLGLGLAVSAAATLVNLSLAIALERVGRRRRSPALLADAIHVRSDVYTSVALYAGFGVAWATGYWVLDALLALAMAVYILWAGVRAMRESIGGLMDEGLAGEELRMIEGILVQQGPPVLEFHDLRTRRAGWRTFVELHLVVAGQTTVEEAHAICDRLELAIAHEVSDSEITIHVEPEGEARRLDSVL